MTRISEIGDILAAHYRFSPNPGFARHRGRGYRNIAPAGRNHPVSDMEVISVGGPTYATMHGAGVQGLKLDNSCHLRLPSALAWQGMILIAGEAHLPDAAHNFPILQFDTAANFLGVAHVKLGKASGACTLQVNNGGAATNSLAITNDLPFVAMAGFDQVAGKAVKTLTGVAPYTEANPNYTSATSGYALSPSGDQDLILGRLLNSADETPQAGYFIASDMAFLTRRPTTDAERATVEGVFTTMKARLGV